MIFLDTGYFVALFTPDDRERPDKEWSLTDCVSFHLMRERGLTRALAYDLHFEQA